jgi:hypothetical protein
MLYHHCFSTLHFEYAIKKIQEDQMGHISFWLTLGSSIDTKMKTETLIDASKEVGLEINV